MHSQTYGRVNARVHEKVLVLFQESFNAITIFLHLRHFLLNVFQEVREEPIKSKLPYMASTCRCDLVIIAVELTSSSETPNHVVFQPISEQAKYGASGILKRTRKASLYIYHFSTVIDFSFEKYSGSTGHRNSCYQ